MGMKIDATDAILKRKVDIEELLRNSDFLDEDIVRAAQIQPKLYLQAAIYRVQKMRRKQRRAAKLKSLHSTLASKARKHLKHLGERATDKQVEEMVSQEDDIIELEASLAKAEQEEEFGKLLLTVMQMRRDSLKINAELVGAEVYVSRKLEGSNTQLDDLRDKLKKKYPGQYKKEGRR